MLPLCRDSDDVTNNSTLSEPRVCFDINCTYPYGNTCAVCTFYLGLKELSSLAATAEQNMANWIKESGEYVREPNGEPIVVEDLGASARDLTEGSLDSSSDPQTMRSNEDQFLGQHTEAGEESTPGGTIHPALGQSDYLNSGRFEKWLIEIFEDVHKAMLRGRVFVGGAEDGNSTEDGCLFCFGPLGDPGDQHLLRCRYAHEEQARMRTLCERQKIEELKKET